MRQFTHLMIRMTLIISFFSPFAFIQAMEEEPISVPPIEIWEHIFILAQKSATYWKKEDWQKIGAVCCTFWHLTRPMLKERKMLEALPQKFNSLYREDLSTPYPLIEEFMTHYYERWQATLEVKIESLQKAKKGEQDPVFFVYCALGMKRMVRYFLFDGVLEILLHNLREKDLNQIQLIVKSFWDEKKSWRKATLQCLEKQENWKKYVPNQEFGEELEELVKNHLSERIKRDCIPFLNQEEQNPSHQRFLNQLHLEDSRKVPRYKRAIHQVKFFSYASQNADTIFHQVFCLILGHLSASKEKEERKHLGEIILDEWKSPFTTEKVCLESILPGMRMVRQLLEGKIIRK